MNHHRVLLADDHLLFREALRAVVSRLRPDFAVEQAESLDGARQALLRDPKVELVLLDLKLPGCDGLLGLLALRAEFPHVPVVVVSVAENALVAGNAITAGALGFIPKSTAMATMTQALEAILAGDIWTPEHLVLNAPGQAVKALASLNPVQARLLPCLGRGLSQKRIAMELGITEASVKAEMTAAFRKLGVATRTQALRLVASQVQAAPSTSAEATLVKNARKDAGDRGLRITSTPNSAARASTWSDVLAVSSTKTAPRPRLASRKSRPLSSDPS